MLCCFSYGFNCLQLKDLIDKRSTDIRKLEKRINEIVDRLFKNFSQSVGVANIREYEENQLKAAQNMAEERLSLSNQLAKLKYQYVFSLYIIFSIISLPCCNIYVYLLIETSLVTHNIYLFLAPSLLGILILKSSGPLIHSSLRKG